MQSMLTSRNIASNFREAGLSLLCKDIVVSKLRGREVEERLPAKISTGRRGRTGVSIRGKVLTSREGLSLIKELAKKFEEREKKNKEKEKAQEATGSKQRRIRKKKS